MAPGLVAISPAASSGGQLGWTGRPCSGIVGAVGYQDLFGARRPGRAVARFDHDHDRRRRVAGAPVVAVLAPAVADPARYLVLLRNLFIDHDYR